VINLLIVVMPQTIAPVSCYTVKVNCQYLFLILICCICFVFALPRDGEIKLYNTFGGTCIFSVPAYHAQGSTQDVLDVYFMCRFYNLDIG